MPVKIQVLFPEGLEKTTLAQDIPGQQMVINKNTAGNRIMMRFMGPVFTSYSSESGESSGGQAC